MAVARASTSGADLDWLVSALFAPEVRDQVAEGPGHRRFDWITEPAEGPLRLLVPVDPAAAAAVARRTSDGKSIRDRARGLVAEVAFRSGAAQRLPGRRLTLGASAAADRPETSLVSRVEEVSGRVAHSVAVTLGPRRYNRKPVVMCFDDRGRPFAVAKVGVDPVTDGLVANEGAWLERAARAPGPTVPAVRHRGEWCGHPLVVMAPITTPRWPRRLGLRPPPRDLVEAVAAIDGTALVPVASSPVLDDLQSLSDPGARLVAAADVVVERFGRVPVRHGSWHGDLTPWNLATTGRGMIVWDWELAASGRPVGADLAQSRVLTALELGGRTRASACAAARPEDHAAFQPDERAAEAAWALHLLDLARRERAAALAGADALPGLAEPALDLVTSHD